MSDQQPFHSRMAEAAEIGAGNFERTGFRGFEPNRNFSSWQGVLLQPKMRQEKAMDHVFRREDDVYRLLYRNVELVVCFEIVFSAEFTVRSRINKFPVELLSHRVHDEIGGRALEFDLGPDIGAADIDDQVEHHNDRYRNENPGELSPGVARGIDGLAAGLAPVAEYEIKNQPFGDKEPYGGDVKDQPEDAVDVAAES